MPQHDMVIDNGPGLAVRQDINAAIQALVANSSGPVEPTTKYPGQFWQDTTVAPNGTLRQRNQSNTAWATEFTVASSIVTPGNITSGGNFASSSAFAIVGSNGGVGGVLLRPNGVGSTAGQLAVENNGTVTMTGSISCTSVNAVLGCAGGIIYLRPNGVASGVGNMTVNATGIVTCHGYAGRQGTSGSTSASHHNWYYSSPNIQAWIDGTNFGNVTLTSDYRIKKDVQPLGPMWDVVKAMRPISYSHADYGDLFKASADEQWGFIAHEVQEDLLPTAASGVKDAENEVQGLNLAPIVAALTKALQEAMARIEALEAA